MRYLLISILFILSLCGSVAAQNTTPSTSDFYTWPIVSGATGQKATVAGKIDLNKYSNVSNLKIELVLSLNPGFSNAVKYNSHKTSGGTEEGVSTDGTYFWSLGTQTPTLTPSTTYYIRQNIYEGSTLIATKDDKFNSSKGYIPEGSQEAQDDFNSRSYHLLAPWPGLAVLMDPDLCMQQKAEGKVGQDAICDINGFLNFAFKTLIGLTAVALVLRLIYEGYQYMTTDIPFIQANAKSGFGTALLGLLLALSAYLILNTINPKLVTNDISITGVSVGIEEFTISGSLSSSFNAPPVKIRFNDEAYPAAKKAAEKTGVKATLILAIFDQETGSGLNGIKSTGQCRINEPKANPYPADVAALNQIATELGRSVNDLPVSCTFANANGIYQGHGGAIGYAQALPTTWNTYKNEAKQLLGKSGALDPWNVDDALMFIAVFMKHQGGIASPYQGACKYFGKCSFGGVDYAAQVVSRMATFEKEIEKKKAAGLIK